MHIGEPVRMLTVEPVVDPVPRGDYPERFAEVAPRVPRPTPQFKRRAWLAFQKAIDPLAPPKPLRRQS